MDGVAIDIQPGSGSTAGVGAKDTTVSTLEEESPQGNGQAATGVTASSTNTSPPTILRKLSVSQTANEAADGWNAPWFLSFIEYPFHVKDPVDGSKLPEAAGWGMDSAARGPLNQIGGYVGSAIIRLAAKDAGCVKGPRECDIAVRGGILKPSSLLTATSTIVGIAAAILMPFVGAIVDHTSHRKFLGMSSGFIVVLVAGLQIMISIEPNNWLFILCLDAIGSFGLLVHTTAVFSYLPDLTTDEDSIPQYTAAFTVRQYSAQVVFGALLLLTNKMREADKSLESSVTTARDGSGIAFGFGCLFIGYAWLFLFRKRPPLSQVPEGQSLATTGFVQVKNTASRIWKDYNALKWFMISLLFSPEVGSGVALSIVVSFFTVDVKISSTELAYFSLILMGSNIFGAFFSKWVTRKINPLNSYRWGLMFLAVSIGVSTAIIKGPEEKNAAIGFSAWWGFAMGWLYSSQRVLFCTLSPKGQETEMMGLFTFTGQILGWLPPLIVTTMNENGVGLRFGMLVVTGFCVLAVIMTLPMGNYQDAVKRVATDSEAKLHAVIAQTKASKLQKLSTNGNTPPHDVSKQSELSDGAVDSA